MRWCWVLLASAAWAQSREAIEKQLKSVAQQREAIRRMAGLDASLLPPAPSSSPPECDPLGEEEVAPMIDRTAKAQQLPGKLLRAVIAQESGFRACAVSSKGAKDL